MKLKRNAFILSLCLLILAVEIIILMPHEMGTAPPTSQASEKELTSQKEMGGSGQLMGRFHLVLSKGDRQEGELWGREASRPKDSLAWTIDKVRVRFYADNGVTYLVTGEKGYVVTNQNDVRITGHVVTKSSNGYTFITETLLYESSLRKLHSPEHVEMIGPNEEDGEPSLRVVGNSMAADMKSNEINIDDDVHARRKVRDGKLALITSKHAKFSGKTRLAQFFGDVVIDVETLRITGPDAVFRYKPNSEVVESMAVTGGVKVTDIDKWATSDKVDVYFEEDRFVFHGSPRVVQNSDELRGDEITFLNGGHKVLVSNAKAKIEQDAPSKDAGQGVGKKKN